LTRLSESGRKAAALDRFQLAAQAANCLMWDWDLRRGEIIWAGMTRPYFGVAPGEVVQMGAPAHQVWAQRVHPDDLATAETVSRAAIETGAESWEHEYRFRRADDGYAYILERAFISRDDTGRAVRIIGAIEDVSEWKSSEGATTRLAAITATSTDAIISKTLDGIVTAWNPAAERLFGYTEKEMVGRSIFVLIPEELHGEEQDLLQRIRRGERVDFADAERIRKDGGRIDIALTVSPVFNAAGEVVGASSIKRDITERKRAGAELARREERYRALVTATTSIVWTADPDGHFDGRQTSWQAYTGQAAKDQEGYGWMNAVHADDRESFRASWFQARDQRTIWEYRTGRLWSHAHRSHRHFTARAVPVVGPDGEIREWIGTVTDGEDRWLAEERLRQAERLESIGRLAGGIAHEANNQMTVILGAAEFLDRAITDEYVRADVEHVRKAARRTAAITQQLLAYSRRQVLQPQVVDLNDIVAALEPILQRALGEISQLRIHLSPDIGRARADPGQMDQVLLNLVLNARDAMPTGGTLTIRTDNVEVPEHEADAGVVDPVTPGSYVTLTVSDTGTGMDRETLAHVFEPFFTTKGVGEGTGLGLATVYGIVKQSGGFVTVQSEPGVGSSFQIYLPIATPIRDPSRRASPGDLGGGGETILVAEDEPSVRAIVARSLREYGYAVLDARDGTHALELARDLERAPDLLIADVVMPGMGGKQLAEILEALWPGMPVLFISGYTGLDAIDRRLLDEGRDFLQKPLEPEALARRVRQILNARVSRPAAP
jgi:PAS domain S-box-containing protein